MIKQEYILCAAIWYKELSLEDSEILRIRGMQPFNIDKGIVISGWRHGNCIAITKSILGLRTVTLSKDGVGEHQQGFLTSKNRFVDRHEAMKIAFEANQVDESIVYYEKSEPFCKGLEITQDYIYNPLFSEDLY